MYYACDKTTFGRNFTNDGRSNAADAQHKEKNDRMKPDQRWFPTNLVEQAAWFRNFAEVFASIALDLRFTQADIDSVLADNEVVQFLARDVTAMRMYERALRAFQRSMFYGRNGARVAEFPAAPEQDPPLMVNRGIFERLERLVRRIRTMPGYTPSVGANLGIIPRNEKLPELAAFVPRFRIIPSQSRPYSFEVKTTRGKFDGFIVEHRRGASHEWERATLIAGSSGEIRVEPLVYGHPEMLNVRIRMCLGNDAVGSYSDQQSYIISP